MQDTPQDQPSFQPTSSEPTEPPEIVPNPTPVTPVDSISKTPGNGKHKLGIIILLVIVLAVAAGVAVYFTKHHTTQTVSTKKDIPYLSYGTALGGGISVNYPVKDPDTSTTGELDAQLFEGLVRYQDQTKIVPLLATSWFNPDNNTWVFNLRHGVKFHSGRTMTAADVKYSLDYAVAHQSDDDSSNLALASTISQVDVVNPYQVKIITNGPDPVLLNRLTYLYIVDSKATLGDPNAGTGPYIIKPGTKATSTTIDLTALNNYWGGHVYTRAIHFQAESNNNQLAADTAKGKYDLAGDFDAKQLATIKNYRPIVVPDLGVTFLGLNTLRSGSPLQSLAARQAVAYALNVPAILKAGGLEGVPVSQLIPPAIPGYDPSIARTPYNPTKAKELLASVENASAPITLSYVASDQNLLTEVGKELTAVGFNVKLSTVASLDDLVNQGLGGQTDMFYLTYTSNTLDGLDIIDTTVEGNQDFTNTDLDSLTKQASSTLDPAARIAILQKIERLVNSNVPAVPLYSETRTYTLTKPYVINVDIPSTDTGTYFWQVYQH